MARGHAALAVVGLALAFLTLSFAALAPPAAAGQTSAVTPYLLGLDFPVAMAFAPDGRLFFNEKYTGQIRIIDTTGFAPALLAQPLDVVPSLNTSNEMGLLGIALDPDWQTTPWVYVFHTFDNGTLRENRITRYFAATNVSSRNETVFAGIPAWDFHNGGILQFGPDGKLWVTTGDSNDGGRSPDVTYLGGKVLRINRDGSIPSDNPFAGSPVFSTGHRNVFGLTFNPRTGAPYITENGELTNDEVNFIRPGRNYGWPWDSGFANNGSSLDPIWAITPTIAPTGIVADTSRHLFENETDLIFGDWNTASLRRLTIAPPAFDAVVSEELIFTRAVSHILDLDFGPGGLLFLSTPEGIYTTDLHTVGNQLPLPSLTANRTVQFVGFPMSFSDADSFDPEAGGIFAHEWQFGDGTNASGSYVNHSYAAAGAYTVTLTVADELNARNSTTITVRIVELADNQPPVASILASRLLQFENRPIGFSGGNSTDPEDGGIRSYTWAFSDGTNDTGSYVLHNFTTRGSYTVRLTVTDEFGVPGSTSVAVRVLSPLENRPPVAVASASSLRAWIGWTLNFTGAASSDAEGGIVARLWQFGDGTTSTLGYAPHLYAAAGAFLVVLTVWDELNASSNATLQVTVLDPVANLPPRAVITPPDGLAKVGVSLFFTGATSSDAEGGIFGHEWFFGDGTWARGAVAYHTYAAPGRYNVRLAVADELGAVGEVLLSLEVYATPIPAKAAFVSNDWTASVGRPLYFDGSSSASLTGSIVDAWYDFGDGRTAKGLQVEHTFRAPGDYLVTLRVLDSEGATGSASSVVRITEAAPERASFEGFALVFASVAAILALAARPRRG